MRKERGASIRKKVGESELWKEGREKRCVGRGNSCSLWYHLQGGWLFTSSGLAAFLIYNVCRHVAKFVVVQICIT